MSRLTQDMTDETVSRDQILRHARGQGNIHFPCSADHEQDWQPCQVDPYRVTLPAVMRRTFLISVPNRGLENRKKDNTSACSSRPCLKIEQVDWDNCPCFKQGTLRRLDSGGSWYKLDSGWDSGRHRNRNPNHNKHLCVCYFFPLFLFFCLCFFGCSDGMEREACVCDHGYERSDLCAEIIIIIIMRLYKQCTDQYQNGSSNLLTRNREQTRSTRKQTAQSPVDVVLPHDCYYDITLTGY